MDTKLQKIATYSLLAIAIMFATLLVFNFTQKREFDHHRHHHYEYGFKPFHCKFKEDMDELFEDINLTPEQKTKLDNIMQASRKEQEPIIDSMIDKKKELIQYLATPEANIQTALEKKKELLALHEQLAQMHLKAIFEAKEVLTQEQAEKISEYHQKRLDHFKKEYKHWFDNNDCDDD
jgi:Spy/CpxP family protein refolding chaperone